eukprot:2825078-Amphidinium_carterae.1
MGRVTPAQPQPPQQQATAVQEHNAEKQGSTRHMETAAPAVTTTGRAPETPGQKTTNVELVYH